MRVPAVYLSNAGDDSEQDVNGVADPRPGRHQQRVARRHQHEVAKHSPGTESVCHPAAWDLGDEVAPEERAEDDALDLLAPREVALLRTVVRG